MQIDAENFSRIKLAGFFLAFFFCLALQNFLAHEKKFPSRKVNLALGLLNGLLFSTVGFGVILWAISQRWGLLHQLQLPFWGEVLLSVLFLDLASNLWHRWNHFYPFLWSFHRVHHSERHMDAFTALRFHAGEVCLSYFLRIFLLASLGISLKALLVFECIFQFFNFFEHSDLSLPPRLESLCGLVFVTPAQHRLHHSALEKDLNFGTIFSFWDRLLGRFRRGEADYFPTGLEGVGDLSFWELLTMPKN